jgi:predicted branched-subunit amino acid permease
LRVGDEPAPDGADEDHGPIWRHAEFRRGANHMLPASLGIAAWGLVTGIAMVKGGLSVPMALFMSLVMFSGSAQLGALPLIAAGSPLWVVWATALCLNLRFVIFSAGWRPYFAHLPLGQRLRLSYFAADFNYVLFMSRWPEPKPQADQWPYFWGGVAVNWGSWQALSIAGILIGDRIPPEWGLGFAGVLALIGLTCTLLTDRATWAAAVVAGAAAVAAYALPYKLNIVLAIASAVAIGATIDAVTSSSARRATRRETP